MPAPSISLTRLFDWNSSNNQFGASKQFEAITDNTVFRLDDGTFIPAKWKNVNLTPGNQMCCGCCWAYSCAKVAFARYCIHTGFDNTTANKMFSVDMIIACLLDPSLNSNCNGCQGGDMYSAWYTLTQNKIPFVMCDVDKCFQASNAAAASPSASGDGPCNILTTQCQQSNPPNLPNAKADCSDDPKTYNCGVFKS